MSDSVARFPSLSLVSSQIHAFLDNGKASYKDVAHRCAYYSKLLHTVFRTLGVPVERLEFVTGSEYQLGKDYSMDNFR